MIHKDRGNRRYIKNKKIIKRIKMLKELGEQGGTLFEKHLKKVHKSGGYMSKHGNYTHYGKKSHYGPKTNSNDYGPAKRWSPKDKKQIDSINEQLDDFYLDQFQSIDKSCNGCYYQEQYNIEGHITPICHHKASMENLEAKINYYFCEEITECDYFQHTQITCKNCQIKDGEYNCYYKCPKLKTE